MELVWLAIVAVMIAVYVVMDGFDIGAGILSCLLAKEDKEKRQILQSIGPVWDGNEVWLLAGGGVLYFAFPALYASGFSGFYLPLMIVLWLLILRGISIELRGHVDSPLWKPFWDNVFGGASILLAIFFGAALGNVVRGVPLESSGFFFLPLWTDFGFGPHGLSSPEGGFLDWYTILVGVLALLTLTLHGAKWLIFKTAGSLQEKCLRIEGKLWIGVVLMVVIVTLATFSIQPQVMNNFKSAPWGFIFPLLAVAGLAGMLVFRKAHQELKGFLASALYIVGMLTGAAFGIFPYVLPSSTNPELALTVYSAKAADYGLWVGFLWWVPGMILVTIYFVYTYRMFSGKVEVE